MQKWEYLVLAQEFDNDTKDLFWDEDHTDSERTGDKLNSLGEDGWELVSVETFGMGSVIIYYLKRPAQK